jgi:hypothetical protein
MKDIRLVEMNGQERGAAWFRDVHLLCEGLSHAECRVKVAAEFDPESLNIACGQISAFSSATIREFCSRYGKKVAIVVDETIALRSDSLTINGAEVFHSTGFDQRASGMLRNLAHAIPYIRFFLALEGKSNAGELASVFCRTPVLTLPWPLDGGRLRESKVPLALRVWNELE